LLFFRGVSTSEAYSEKINMKENFIGNTRKYEEKLKEALLDYKKQYYEDFLNKSQFSADWPIHPDTPNFHLACYFGENNYAAPSASRKHTGIDIQALKGAEVFAPEEVEIMYGYQLPEDHKDMSNLVFQGLETKLIYNFSHIDSNSITKDRIIKRGDFLCRVGDWIWKIDSRKIPKDVKQIYGKGYNHLHISTHRPDGGGWQVEWKIPGRFDPLLLFKKLS
jgi:hypothetical protein